MHFMFSRYYDLSLTLVVYFVARKRLEMPLGKRKQLMCVSIQFTNPFMVEIWCKNQLSTILTEKELTRSRAYLSI